MKRKITPIMMLLALMSISLASCSFSFINSHSQESQTSSENNTSDASSDSLFPVVTLEEISLEAENVKKDYFTGESLSLDNLTVYAHFSDQSVLEIAEYEVNIAHGTALSEAGSKNIVVTYHGKSAQFSINVTSPVLTGITIDTKNVKTDYLTGDAFDLSNLVVTASYSSGQTAVISDYTTDLADGTILDTAGKKTVTISFGNFQQEFDINVTLLNGGLTATKPSYTYMDYMLNSGDMSSTPSIGEAKLLVIPIWFKDSNSYIATSNKEIVRSDIEKAYFGSNEDTGWRSVKTYYEEESHGALTLNGTVSNWYSINSNSSSYADENSGVYSTVSLVTTASNWYFQNNPSDSRDNYDCDNDGYLDGVILIYGAPDSSATGREDEGNFWAYTYWTGNDRGSVGSPTANAFFWASYDFMYGHNIVQQKTGVASRPYATGDTTYAKIDTHTFIHEMGHMFGLEDYYDYSGQYSPAGGFSMQDENVGGHDPFSSFSLGWGKAYIPTETSTFRLKPFATTGEMIILSPNWNTDNSPFDEYIIIEYFTRNGLNQFDSTHAYRSQYPTGSKKDGIRVWHVDARLLYTTDGRSYDANKVTTNPSTDQGYVTLMMSNTYSGGSSGYISPLGSRYVNYNVLQLIRNKTTATYKPTDSLATASLFYEGDTFTMSKFKSQFYKSGKLNSTKQLGFTFEVGAIEEDSAIITVTKS